VLLDSDPLEAVDSMENIAGVMANGYWKSSLWFAQQLEAIAESYGN